MDSQIEELKKQILEVPRNPRGRRIYPASVKSLVRSFAKQGIRLQDLAEQTGIHVSTLHTWCPSGRQKSGFKEVKVSTGEQSLPALEIHLASGARITGLNSADLVQFLKQDLIR